MFGGSRSCPDYPRAKLLAISNTVHRPVALHPASRCAMSFYPSFISWIRESAPSPQPAEEAYQCVGRRLDPVLISQFRKYPQFRSCSPDYYDDEVAGCREEIFRRMEEKLSRPAPVLFDVKLVPRAAADDVEAAESESIASAGTSANFEPKPLHLLKPDPFVIAGHHPDLQPARKYCAEIRDARDKNEVVRIPGLVCSETKRVPVQLAYSQLSHEQDAQVEVSPEDDRLAYFCYVRPVRHESHTSRMQYVTGVARLTCKEFLGRHQRPTSVPLESLSTSESPAAGDERLDPTVLMARHTFEQMPQRERRLLIENVIVGRSWEEVGRDHGISADKAKKDVSRALARVSGEIAQALAKKYDLEVTVANRGFVDWLKDMLPQILRKRP